MKTSYPRIQSEGQIVWLDDEGLVHRGDDKPAVIFADGELGWCKHGRYHRDGGKPAVIYSDGEADFYSDGALLG